MPKSSDKLWRGRIKSPPSAAMQSYLSSFAEDSSLADIDIDVGEVHAIVLLRAGFFSRSELARVLKAYESARRSLPRLLAKAGGGGVFHDIHPLVEKLVLDACGEEIGGRIHLGKSRNDQVSADTCVYARRRLSDVIAALLGLARALIRAASRNSRGVMPAYTHTRPGQSTTVAHFLLSHAEAVFRDVDRLAAARARINLSPLGACAVAGTSIPLDRDLAAGLLGFEGVWENSLDATSSRDCILEAVSTLAIAQGNLSRLAFDIIFLSSEESGVFSYPDEFADTSTAMPQKKNPDPVELIRARAGTAAGNAAAAFSIVHGLPAGYSRDLQELKPVLWRNLEIVRSSAEIAAMVVSRLGFNRKKAEAILEKGYASALDVAEFLCRAKGVPFRRAHYAVGLLVQKLIKEGRTFGDLRAEEAAAVMSAAAGRKLTFNGNEWRDVACPLQSYMARKSRGGPGSTQALLKGASAQLKRLERLAAAVNKAERKSRELLRREVAAKSR